MNPQLRSGLQTKVAGRMTLVFFLCAGLPLAALAARTIARTSSELSTRAVERLRYESRTMEQEALGRLNRLSDGLQTLGVAMQANRTRTILLNDFLPMAPSAAVVRFADGSAVGIAGNLEFPALSANDEQHLADWGRLIRSERDPALLIVGATSGTFVAATLDERWLLGLDEVDHLPPDSSACVATIRGRPRCSTEVNSDLVAQTMARFDHTHTTIEAASGTQVAWVSTLSLDAQYNSPPWKIVLLRPLSSVREPIVSFVKDLLLVVILTALVVAWISMRQVQRQLKPLVALTAATARLADHDFDRVVEVNSGDEFEVLGRAFNDMAAKLRQQFADLEAFNIGTLTTLARAIDAKSPWTAGHSERVTTSAVAIGTALGLPASEVDELRKGGLVHDIGKIATPLEILDKPARLTPDEERIMRLHPEQGVHILEPIAAFRPVLPIVGQHHERWDGTGYPLQLSGTAIARTARVLAVADVYDALRSDRPYRPGMPHAKVVSIIRAGSGSHFDPAVVDAFLRIEAHIDRGAGGESLPTPSSRSVRAAG